MVSTDNQFPNYPWVEEQEASKNATTNLVEMNHIAGREQQQRSINSFGIQDRDDKIGFAIRDAVERTGWYNQSRVETVASEGREATLTSQINEAAQKSANFKEIIMASKENQRIEAENIGAGKFITLTESLRADGERLREGDKTRREIAELATVSAQNTDHVVRHKTKQVDELKNHHTLEFSHFNEHWERDTATFNLLALENQEHFQRGVTAYAFQREKHFGDDDRRRVNYRANVDERVDRIGATLALQFAEFRNQFANQAVENTSKLEECCCETKGVVVATSGQADIVIQENTHATISAALAAQNQANIFSQRTRT
jgi:hypothetical protein